VTGTNHAGPERYSHANRVQLMWKWNGPVTFSTEIGFVWRCLKMSQNVVMNCHKCIILRPILRPCFGSF